MPQARVYLHRWAGHFADQDSFAATVAGCRDRTEAAELALVLPTRVLARRSRSWLRVRADGETWLTNGVVLLYSGQRTDGDVKERVERFVGAEAPLQRLATVELDRTTTEFFAVWTTVYLALDEISEFDRQRPKTVGDLSVEHFERLIAHPLLRYSAGVGAQFRVVAPWRRHVAAYRERIQELSVFWQRVVAPCAQAATKDEALRALFEPLTMLEDFSHDEDIQAEYESRLGRVSHATEAVVRRVGGGFAVLSVVVGFYSLVTAAILAGVAALYVYGASEVFRIAQQGYAAITPIRRRRRRRMSSVEAESTLEDTLRRVATGPATVLVGEYLAVIDFACGFAIWVDLVERLGPSGARLTSRIPENGGAVVVVGGPLSVPVRRGLPQPVCALEPLDAIFSRWGYRASEGIVVTEDQDDTIGCLSCALGDNRVLYVDGFRSIGVEIAADAVREFVRGRRSVDARDWILLRYDYRTRRPKVIESSEARR